MSSSGVATAAARPASRSLCVCVCVCVFCVCVCVHVWGSRLALLFFRGGSRRVEWLVVLDYSLAFYPRAGFCVDVLCLGWRWAISASRALSPYVDVSCDCDSGG
jgi:hypothetical protein